MFRSACFIWRANEKVIAERSGGAAGEGGVLRATRKDRGIVFRRNVSVATYFPRLGININAIKWKIKARCRFTIHLLHSRISGTRRRERKGSRKPNRKPPPRGRRGIAKKVVSFARFSLLFNCAKKQKERNSPWQV